MVTCIITIIAFMLTIIVLALPSASSRLKSFTAVNFFYLRLLLVLASLSLHYSKASSSLAEVVVVVVVSLVIEVVVSGGRSTVVEVVVAIHKQLPRNDQVNRRRYHIACQDERDKPMLYLLPGAEAALLCFRCTDSGAGSCSA